MNSIDVMMKYYTCKIKANGEVIPHSFVTIQLLALEWDESNSKSAIK